MMPRQLGNLLLRFLEGFADLCILSACWLVCCLPVLTVGASSAALYGTVVKVIRCGRGSLVKTFFGAFRENLRQGIVLSLLLAGGCALLVIYNLMGRGISAESGIFIVYWAVVIVLTALLAGTFVYVFALLSRFHQTIPILLQTAFTLGIGYPVKTLGLLCMLAIFVWIGWQAPLLILLLPGVYALLASVIQEPILERHTAGEGPSWKKDEK